MLSILPKIRTDEHVKQHQQEYNQQDQMAGNSTGQVIVSTNKM